MPKCLRTFPPPPCPNEVPGGGFCDEHKPVIQNRTTFEIPRGGGGGDPEAPTGSGGGDWGPGSLDPPTSEPPDGGRGGGYGGGGYGGGGFGGGGGGPI